MSRSVASEKMKYGGIPSCFACAARSCRSFWNRSLSAADSVGSFVPTGAASFSRTTGTRRMTVFWSRMIFTEPAVSTNS